MQENSPTLGWSDQVLPSAAVEALPLSAEPLNQWQGICAALPPRSAHLGELVQGVHNYGSGDVAHGVWWDYSDSVGDWVHNDLLTFLNHLYSGYDSAYGFMGLGLHAAGMTRYYLWAKAFEQLAGRSAPSILERADFGSMAKYGIAWAAVVINMMSESAFCSMPHLLESGTDLECSIVLAASLYYRQAMQVLRNYLEDCVLQLHFCENPDAFGEWQEGDYRTPWIRGKNGMLTQLVSQGLLTEELKQEASDLYGELNGCVHGTERRLVHSGIFSGSLWASGGFDETKLADWCRIFSRVTELGIRLMRIHLRQIERWRADRGPHMVWCLICHNDEGFDVENIFYYKCRRCGHKWPMRTRAYLTPED